MKASLRSAGRWLYGQPYILLTMTALFWAGNAVLGRFVAGHVPPVALAYARWWIALALVAPFVWPHLRRDWPVIRRHVPILLALSLTGITLYNTLAYIGLQYTQAVNGALMQATIPPSIALCVFLLYRERLGRAQIFGIALSFLGVATIVTRGDLAALGGLAVNVGDVWLVAANLCYALYSAGLRKRPPMHGLSFLAITFLAGAILLTPAFVWEMSTGYHLKADATTFLALAYVALFPAILAYICFNRGVELIGPNRAAPFFNLIPLFGSVLAVLLLGETIAPFHAVAYLLIIAGIVIAARR